jgi:hypothetical protein
MFGANPNAGTAVFDCFDSVFDLEIAAIRRKDRIGQVITRSYRGLLQALCQRRRALDKPEY